MKTKTILLIEDNDVVRKNTAAILELAGYAVRTAADGKTGVELALATPPDVVVCDILMPGLDGYGVLQIFNQNPQLAGVPFLFLTAKTEPADQRRAMDQGADDYLTKPFAEAALLSAIAGRLHRFEHLRPDYDLRADGLHEFLADARAAGHLGSLSADRKSHALRRKQAVYLEGDEATRVYFVKSGRIKTVKTSGRGKELITVLYGPGEFFGYLTLLEETPHRDSAVAVDDSELVYIPKEDFAQLLLRNTSVSQQFIRLLAGRVSEREQQLLAMAYGSIRRRVADALVQLHEQPGGSPEGGIQLSREDMAAMVGTAPESLSRTLSEFRHNGLIELMPNAIRVLHPDRLRQANW